ncbi:MAG: 4-vinyl reductase [Anaerolineales bacterium]|jgi:predicted hydrocarbon binding protein
MQQIPKSGYYNTNKFARIALQAYEEVMGKNGLNAILNLASLSNLIDNYPPDNLERQFDFADYTAIHIGLEELYGPRGGRGLALRAGRSIFSDVLKDYGALAGVSDLAFKVLPLQTKIRIGLPAAARIFSQVSDQLTSVDETDDAFIWTIHRCPTCWSRKGADKPVCYITTGLLQAMLTWVSGGSEFRVNESKCCAVSDAVCEFVIQKEPLS